MDSYIAFKNVGPASKFGHFWGFLSYFIESPNKTSPKGEPESNC